MTGARRCVACTSREATIDELLCTVCFNDIAVPCYGKIPHRRYSFAVKAANATPDPNDSAYRCPVCGLHHIGHTGQNSRLNTDRARTTVRAIRTNGYGWILTLITARWRYADRYAWKTRGTAAYRQKGTRTT